MLLEDKTYVSIFYFRYEKTCFCKNFSTLFAGGTDIISCFIGANPLLPVYEGEIQCRLLGMAIKTLDVEGNEVMDERGELVCTKPFPSMPIYFWNDDGNIKYMKAYFSK